MKQIFIQGRNIVDIPSFYREINRVFMKDEDWELGESLDAFNDLLYGGFGAMKGHSNMQLIWLNAERCSKALGYNITKEYYLNKLMPGSIFNKDFHRQKLDELEAGIGQTYFQIIVGIISDHPNIQLVCK